MLVLSRKRTESIVIGDGIVVTIVDVKGSTVRIGIEAPKDIRILRTEVVPTDLGSGTDPACTDAVLSQGGEQ